MLYLLYEIDAENGEDVLAGIVDDLEIAEAWQNEDDRHYVESEVDNEKFVYLLIE